MSRPASLKAATSRWESVADDLDALCAGPSAEQTSTAAKLGVALPPDLPAPVAARVLLSTMQQALGIPKPTPTRETSIKYLKELERNNRTRPPRFTLNDQETIEAFILASHSKRAAKYLRKLKPEIGDIVISTTPSKKIEGVISSIGTDGKLFLRGGFGRQVRPHLVTKVIRKGDASYDALRKRVANQVAEVRADVDTGYARMDELREWRVHQSVSDSDVLAVEDALNDALHEEKMQAALEAHPSLLGNLITGNHGCFVISQKSLGGKFQPDFLVGGVTSVGFRWLLVELESPSADLTIKDGQASQQVRKGIKQILEWREWISENLASARAPKSSHGLGLPGIRSDAEGLVIVSRDRKLSDGNRLRAQILRDSNIEIRTYDWLLRQARVQGAERRPFGVPDDAW